MDWGIALHNIEAPAGDDREFVPEGIFTDMALGFESIPRLFLATAQTHSLGGCRCDREHDQATTKNARTNGQRSCTSMTTRAVALLLCVQDAGT